MQPTARSGRVDKLVTNLLLTYTNEEYIADNILPVIPNLKDDSGIIPGISNEHLRIYSAKRDTYDTSQKRVSFSYTQDKRYNIEYYDLDGYVPDVVMEQADTPFSPRRDSALVTTQSLKLEREYALAQALTDTSILTQNVTLSGTSQFSDYLNSTPETVIRDAKTAVFRGCGRKANRIAMSYEVLQILQVHPFFLNQVRGVQLPSEQDVIDILKRYFGFKSVYIGSAVYNSAKDGQAEVLTPVWGKDIIVFYSPDTPTMFELSLGYSFQLTGRNYTVRVRREPNADKGELVNVEHARDDKILVPNAGYLIKNAVA